MLPNPRLIPMGDRALVIEFGDRLDPELSARIAAAAQHLRASPPPGVLDIVPAYTTLALHYDPAVIGAGTTPYEALIEQIGAWLHAQADAELSPGRLVEIPVCYGGGFGEDLEEVARQHGLTPEEVATIHCGKDYRVHMLGFVPGFAYLGDLDSRIGTPRRDTPRPRVPAGSVAISGDQTGVYPLETPGGWHLIGRTPVRMFTPEAEPPCLLGAGDTVRFVPISRAEFDALSGTGA
ncbi:MAG TPA: 5-oxoprolinase subunit PxpB [Burkholderiales bacterium]|jgi:inhibitor of KinA|nr:5-oxoprolinase subunit PxpB [Burkholderiales bacterium]